MTEFEQASSPGDAAGVAPAGRFSRLFRDARSLHVETPPAKAFAPIRRIGGATGWYYANWLWKVRGVLDRIAGGIGLRRGRRDPEDVAVGDVIDCWRVREFEADRRLRLELEWKIPGLGVLEFEVIRNGAGSIIHQTATYATAGFWGCLYWYCCYPAHELLFGGMLRNIAAAGRSRGSYERAS